MRKLKQRYMSATLFKYFISYFLILALLTLGYSAAFHSELKKIYSKAIYSRAEQQLEHTYTELKDSLVTIDQVNNLLTTDIDVIMSRYKSGNWNLIQASSTLSRFAVANDIIDSICYIHFGNDQIISTFQSLVRTNPGYKIYVGSDYVPLPIDEYMSATTRTPRIFVLQNGKSKLFLYFPSNGGSKRYSFFYILDQGKIKEILSHGQIPGIDKIAFLDYEEQPLVQYGKTPPADETLSGIQTVEIPFWNDYIIRAYLSDHTIVEQTTQAFQKAGVQILALSALGMILIILVMQLTYRPLHKLTKKFLPSSSQYTNYVEQLDQAFTDMQSENKQLHKKINTYRVSIQKSLLDSIVEDNTLLENTAPATIDRLFCMEPDSHIFLVRISTNTPSDDVSQDIQKLRDVQKLLNDNLPGDDPSILLLEVQESLAIFLIYYSGSEPDKDEILYSLFTDLHQETGYLAALSDSAESPMEIPQLYAHAQSAASFWGQSPVVKYSDIEDQISLANDLAYPYTSLDQLTDALKSCQVTQAKEQILYMFELLDGTPNHLAFPDFYIKCVLIDILTILSNAMNTLNVKFNNYNDLYFDTLFLCRSCSYAENRETIQKNILQLLTIYEEEYQSTIIQTSRIEEIIQKQYASPYFSISYLADTFHVSIAYMSYFFKKTFNANFSDYLWNIRMEKAKDMLLTTDKNIDQISLEVGYLNASSFRRKFKQETGVTPSAFRTQQP